MQKFFKAGLVAAALCGALGAQAATQDSTNLAVTLTVTASCTITTTAPTMGFGTHAQTATGPFTTSTNITVTCATPGTTYNLALGPGANYSGGSRNMASGANLVPYELYRDAGYSQVWGNTIGTNTMSASDTNTFTVYGRVPSVSFPGGVYADTVLVTVDY